MNSINDNFKTLLVSVEYSDRSLIALQQAIAIANYDTVSTLHVVHVVKHSSFEISQRDVQRGELQVWLANALERSGARPHSLDIRAHLVHGDPAQSIVQLASDLRIDTVIVATHGRTGVERMVVGSVAEQVGRTCGCPVLVARRKEHRNALPRIEPACAQCLQVRAVSAGSQVWCEQHEERHGRRHTYYSPRASSWVTSRISM